MTNDTKKIALYEQVFQKMKQMIIDHKWEAGERLPSEDALCKLFEVSRVTIRNALQKLNALGLVETFLGDGSYVKKLDSSANITTLIPIAYLEDDFDNILEFRKEMESGACAIAAKKATAEDVAKLKFMVEKMLSLQDDLEALAQADLDFHYSIAQISRNSLIIKTYEIISDAYSGHMQRLVKSMGGELGVYYHEKIVSAIEEHNEAKAREIMYEHIDKNVEFIQTGRAMLPK